MITPAQIEELKELFKIDRYTIFREYLQLLFLTYLYQLKQSTKIYFKGGTAIHLLFGSPRFSEDLDFSTSFEKKQLKTLINSVQKQMEKEINRLKIFLLYQGKKSIRFRLKYSLPDFKYPFAIRIDFQEKEKPKEIIASPLVTKFPLIFFPIINHLSGEEILVEKIIACLTRSKGRDIFDLWYLLEKGLKIDKNLLRQKLKKEKMNIAREALITRITHFPEAKLKSDLVKFLPLPQRKIINMLKPNLAKTLETRGL